MSTFEERQAIEKSPLSYKIFKGVKGKFGAIRLTLKRPWQNTNSKKQEGVLFLEAAPPIGNNVYDWENQKIIIALGLIDVSKLLYFFKSPAKFEKDMTRKEDIDDKNYKVSIYHDKGAGTADKGKHIKVLNINKSKDPQRTNFFLNLSEKDNGKETSANLPLSPEEGLAMMVLLEKSIPAILSWTAIGPNPYLEEDILEVKDDVKRIGKMLQKYLEAKL